MDGGQGVIMEKWRAQKSYQHIPSSHFLVIFPIKGKTCSFLFKDCESLNNTVYPQN